MVAPEKRNKIKGFIGTILFHALVLIAFLFMGLTYQDPPPLEEGISINFGFNDTGVGEIEPEDIEEINEISESEIIEEQIENIEEVITQSTEENIAVKKIEKINKKEKKYPLKFKRIIYLFQMNIHYWNKMLLLNWKT